MTLLEIYNAVAGLVYGDTVASVPPTHEVTYVQTLILRHHTDCQIGYNYYWQKVSDYEIPIVAGTQEYDWPADFKELIESDNSSWSYTDTGFRLNTTPSSDSTMTITYWSILTTPATWTATYTDAVTTHLQWYIIYAVTAELLLKRQAISEATSYAQYAELAEFRAQQLDYHRRQSTEEIF